MEIDIVKFVLLVAQKFSQIWAISKPNSDLSFDHRIFRMVLNVT